MTVLDNILHRPPDPEADEVPGKDLPVPVLADSCKQVSHKDQCEKPDKLGSEARESTNTRPPKGEQTAGQWQAGSRGGQKPLSGSDKRDGAKPDAGGSCAPPAQSITSLPQALDASVAFLNKYMRWDNDYQAPVCALWAALCWVFLAFDFAPYLFIRSPEKRCGKSRLVKCLRCLVPQKPRQVYTASISISDLARRIHKHKPILFIEEIDKFFANGNDDPIVGVLNAGWEVGATYDRYNVQLQDSEEFNIFGPKCFSGIGHKLDDTTADRAIHIRLSRQSPDNMAAILREAHAPVEAAPIRDFFEVWARCALKDLRLFPPAFPDDMTDGRQRDMCEPLLAVAQLAGPPWPEIAGNALLELGREADDTSERVQLLKSIRVVFETLNIDRLSSHELLDHLIKQDGPWATLWERDLQANRYNGPSQKMGGMLGEFRIASHNIRFSDGEQRKGFYKADFAHVWKIYCPEEVQREQMGLL